MFGFSKKIEINNDEKEIDEILSRSISCVFPKKEDLKRELMSGKRLKIYIGADATGSQLHLGHSTNFILLEKLRRLGHETIMLFGDFTAMIGDPTDKNATRIKLTKKQVDENIKSWKDQISKILNFEDKKNPTKIKFNSEWLSKLNFNDVINLSSNFTVQQMIERDMFQKRLTEQKPIYLHEFFYPLMQGYDSVVLDVDLEIGGNDQTFNMLAGRTLLEKLKNKNKFVLSTTLLVNPKTGKKLMNKSENDFIALNDSPKNMFGKVMALPDEVIIQMFIDTTFVPLEQIEKYKKELEEGRNPKEIKILLAKEIVKIYYSEKQAEIEFQNFEKTFSKGDIQNFEELKLTKQEKLGDFLVENNVVSSKSEWKRLIDSGAVLDLDKNEKIQDYNFLVTENISLKVGKKIFLKLLF